MTPRTLADAQAEEDRLEALSKGADDALGNAIVALIDGLGPHPPSQDVSAVQVGAMFAVLRLAWVVRRREIDRPALAKIMAKQVDSILAQLEQVERWPAGESLLRQ